MVKNIISNKTFDLSKYQFEIKNQYMFVLNYCRPCGMKKM